MVTDFVKKAEVRHFRTVGRPVRGVTLISNVSKLLLRMTTENFQGYVGLSKNSGLTDSQVDGRFIVQNGDYENVNGGKRRLGDCHVNLLKGQNRLTGHIDTKVNVSEKVRKKVGQNVLLVIKGYVSRSLGLI